MVPYRNVRIREHQSFLRSIIAGYNIHSFPIWEEIEFLLLNFNKNVAVNCKETISINYIMTKSNIGYSLYYVYIIRAFFTLSYGDWALKKPLIWFRG